MSHIQKVKRHKGFKSVGIFLFGTFFGLIITLLTLFFLGLWAYNNLNLKKVEKITNQKINVSSSIKDVTIKDIVKNVSGIVSNLDTYTIGDLEQDFDITIIGGDGFIPAEKYGIDFTSLRQSTFDSLEEDLTKLVDNITLYSVTDAMDLNTSNLGMFETILNETMTYYYNYSFDQNNVYTLPINNSNTEVAFEVKPVDASGNAYAGTGDVYLKIGSYTTEKVQTNDSINIPFQYVPVKSAFNDFDSVINNLKLHEVLEYEKIDNEYYYNGQKVTGILATLADTNIGDLSSEIKTIQLYEVFGYVKVGDTYYTDSTQTQEVSSLISALATATIETIDESIDNLKVLDVFDKNEVNLLQIIDDNTLEDLTILELPEAAAEAIETTTIQKLVDSGIITIEINLHESLQNMTIEQLINFANDFAQTMPTT